MTREELRDYVEEQRNLKNISYHVYSALIDGIDTLEQEPCEDCISRREAIKIFKYENVSRITLRNLSPVTPQPKTDMLDKIRAEITAMAINEQVDEHTMLIRTGEQVKQMALEIIDKYKAESEEV